MKTNVINTARLRLEPIAEAHAARMVDVLADEALYSFTGGEPPALEDLKTRYRALAIGSGREDEVWYNWITHRASDDEPVGFVQATVTGPEADIGWVIGVANQGNGYATEAADAMCRWLRTAGVATIRAHIHPQHTASQRVAERIRLTPTGSLDPDGEEIWTSGVN